MELIYALLLFGALVCFIVAAFSKHTYRVNLLALGLALWVAVPFLQTLRAL